MNTRRIIRVVIRTLIVILILFLLLLIAGDFAINRYINADERRDISKYLPINGQATFDRASIHPFRDFPHLSLIVRGLQVSDSLTEAHGHQPLLLEKVKVRVSLVDWKQKHMAIESVDLEGLNLDFFESENGYSNIAHLLKKKIFSPVAKKKEKGFKVEYQRAKVNMKNVTVHNINESTNQKVHGHIGEINIRNNSKRGRDTLDLHVKLDKININQGAPHSEADDPIFLEKTELNLSADESFSQIKIRDVALSSGHVHFYQDSLGNSNYAKLFGQKENNFSSQKHQHKEKDHSKKLNLMADNAQVRLDDIDFAWIDHPRNKHLEAYIVKVNSTLQTSGNEDHDTTAVVDVDIDVKQLAFNTMKGAFLKDSKVSGQIDARLSGHHMDFSSPDLLVNNDAYNIKAKIHSDKKSSSRLIIIKQDVETEKVRPLLPVLVQNNISAFDISGPFYAKANVLFTPGKKDPRVEVDVEASNTTVFAKGQTMRNSSLSATIINRIYDDERQRREGVKNIRLLLHEFKGSYDEFQVWAQNARITATPENGTNMLAQLKINGKASSASQYLNHDNFFFRDGKFDLVADIDGSIDRLDDMIAATNLNLKMDKLKVHYPSGNTVFPLDFLRVNKAGDKTVFEIKGQTDKDYRPFRIEGEVDRIESLFFTDINDPIQTEADIRATSISWEGIVALFGKDGIFANAQPSDSVQSVQSMKKTLTGIQRSFQPKIRIAIDTVIYRADLQLLDFKSGLKFDDERTLVLEETSFNLEKANVTMDGELKINALDFTRFDFDIELKRLDFDALMPKFDYFGIHLIKQIHDQPDNLYMHLKLSGELDDKAGLQPESINAEVAYESFAEDKFSGRLSLKANPGTKKIDVVYGHSGHPRNFNHLLGTEAYRFDNGYYTVSFQFDDNFETLEQLVEESIFNITIDDAEVYITDLDVTVPLTRIELASIQNRAFYHMLLQSDSLNQEIAFNGVIDNIRHLAFQDTDEPYKITLGISSPRIIWDQLKQIIAYQQGETNQSQTGKAIKESVAKVLSDFNPNVTVQIDTLQYSNKLSFNDIYANAYMDSTVLVMDSAFVSYGNSRIMANLQADMAKKEVLPFDMHLNVDNIDVGYTLKHFDYFDVKALREAKRIDGNIWYDLDMHGALDLDNGGLVRTQTEALMKVKLKDVIVEDLQTLDTITQRFKKKERFNSLQFAPIESQVKIKGERIEIQQTELKSNAIHAFIEGTIDKKSKENLWISVPIYNIKKPDEDVEPKKTGYALAGRMVHLNLISSEDKHDGKVKFHLRKKKFFKERKKGNQFRAFRRKIKRERKAKRQVDREKGE